MITDQNRFTDPAQPAIERVQSRDILKAHIERTRAAGGITIVNHPNYHGEIRAFAHRDGRLTPAPRRVEGGTARP